MCFVEKLRLFFSELFMRQNFWTNIHNLIMSFGNFNPKNIVVSMTFVYYISRNSSCLTVCLSGYMVAAFNEVRKFSYRTMRLTIVVSDLFMPLYYHTDQTLFMLSL